MSERVHFGLRKLGFSENVVVMVVMSAVMAVAVVVLGCVYDLVGCLINL